MSKMKGREEKERHERERRGNLRKADFSFHEIDIWILGTADHLL